MAWPPVLGLNGWEVDPIPDASGGGSEIDDVTEATLPAPSADNANTVYYVTDRRGGCLVKSDGIDNVEVSPAVDDVSGIPTVTMAAAIAAGGALGDLSYVTHASWNQPVLARHDGTRWRPFGGRQPLYRNITGAITSGAAATSGTATSPSVTMVGGMMGINGGFTVEVLAQLDGTPLTVTDGATLDATAFMSNTNNGTNQRRLWSKKVRNQNSASAQLVTTRSSGGDYGAEGTFGTTATTLSKNSANDLAVVVTEAFTSSGAQVMSILNLEIDWIG